ncbi:neurotactin-like [Tachypleus tridentatus]|uniref:neurotactin-like n=1 Tax=Tachypleus tridentatus TaxID=6853 RepID=UPI003FD10326
MDNKEKNGSGTDVNVPVVVTDPSGSKNTVNVSLQTFHCWKWILLGILVVLLVIIAVILGILLTISEPKPFLQSSDALTITECGQVQGLIQDGVYVFQGIPYALPPTGKRRWRPPQSPTGIEDCWNGTFMAHNISKYCYQIEFLSSQRDFSEDCLYLNVYTPSLYHNQLRPVVVYIPGYSLQGYGKDFEWKPNPQLTREKDVIFVTFNYRLSVFGFLALKVLSDVVRPPTSGNYGLYDQIAALKWVNKNIIHFGGDPKKVTVLAYGSGATAAIYLLSSVKSHDLFKQMWITGPSAYFTNKTLQQVEMDNLQFLSNLNCDTRECLLRKTPEDLLTSLPKSWSVEHPSDLPSSSDHPFPSVTVIDGVVVYNDPYRMWSDGAVNDVPVVIGSSEQEIGLWSMDHQSLSTWTWEDFSNYIRQKLDTINTNLTDSVLNFYITNTSTPQKQFYTMVSDVRSVCPVQHLTKTIADTLESNVYSYIVNYVPSSDIQLVNTTIPRLAFSGLDVVAIFDLLDNYLMKPSEQDIQFQRILQELFYTFVHTGKPFVRYSSLKETPFINFLGNKVNVRLAPYENCHVWKNLLKFGRMN